MANLITGDAVTLELRVAALPSRTMALVVDLAVQAAVLVGGLVLVTWVTESMSSEGAAAALILTWIVLSLVAWPTALETVTRGRSLGKAIMGLRVVRDDGGPIRMRHSLVRALAMVFLDLWTTSGVVGGLSALISSNSKRMGDHLAGTLVVGERIPRSALTQQHPILMPPPLAHWATGLELVALPDSLVLSARTFLHRAPTLDPRARAQIAVQLASQVATHVHPPAPPGTPAEAYLSAVLAERTRRSLPPGAMQPMPGWPTGPPGPAPVPLQPYPAHASPAPPFPAPTTGPSPAGVPIPTQAPAPPPPAPSPNGPGAPVAAPPASGPGGTWAPPR